MKKINKMAAAVAATLAMAAVPVNAAGITYTPVNGGKIYLEKYLIMDREANVPNVTFDFAIEAGPNKVAAPDDNTMVYAGNDADAVTGYNSIKINTTNPVTFATGDTTSTAILQLPDAVKNSIRSRTDGTNVNNDPVGKDHYDSPTNHDQGAEWANTKKYARHDIEIDFTGVNFKEPGIYRYIVTEVNPTSTTVQQTPKVITQTMIDNAVYNNAHGIDYDNDTRRVLDVYIEHDPDVAAGTGLKVAGYVLHSNANDAVVPHQYPDSQPDTKADGFVNYFETHNLALEKKVEGNQASHDQYFQFTVEITNAVKGQKFDIVGNYDADTKVNAINTTVLTNPTANPGTAAKGQSVTCDDSGNATITLWLQNGQNAVILGLPRSTYYDVKEDASTLSDQGYTRTTIVNKGITRTDTGTVVSYTPKATTNNTTSAPAQQAIAGKTLPTQMLDHINDVAGTAGITDDTWHEYTNYKNAIIPTGILEAVGPGIVAAVIAGIAIVVFMSARRKKGVSVK